MKAFILILTLIFVGVLGYGYYLHRSLRPLMTAKGANAELRVFEPPMVVGGTWLVDLGFASFMLPDSVVGAPVAQGDTLFVTFGLKSFVGPPVSDEDSIMSELFEVVAELNDERFKDPFSLMKRIYATQPFSVWRIPIMGPKQAGADAALMLVKVSYTLGASVVWVAENDRVGVFWAKSDRFNSITVYDKQERVTQVFMMDLEHKDVEQIVAALLGSYRFVSDSRDEEDWKAEARKAGVPIKTHEVSAGRVDLPSEEERLNVIADEIRARRANEVKERHPGTINKEAATFSRSFVRRLKRGQGG